jgi:hypothetical protein
MAGMHPELTGMSIQEKLEVILPAAFFRISPQITAIQLESLDTGYRFCSHTSCASHFHHALVVIFLKH